jgi:hypothetical protein
MADPIVPFIDHHQHLFSPDIVAKIDGLHAITARDLTSLLDVAGIQRALVLSVAYM